MESGSKLSVTFVVIAAMALSACAGEKAPLAAPERADDPVPVPSQESFIAVPIEADAALLRRHLEREVPRTLWTIDEHFDRCVPRQKVKVLGRKINVMPKLGCDVVGKVTRGAIRLRGEGGDIVAEVPLRAEIMASDVGGVLKGETATGTATAYARISLDLANDWTPRARVRLSYAWRQEPGIDFLGQRIRFTRQADEKLQPVIRGLERSLPRELEKMRVRPQVDRLWQAGVTTLSLNEKNPPVWLRLTPSALHYGGYALRGNRVRLMLGLAARTETFVGTRPPDPESAPLPAPERGAFQQGFAMFVPVVADYAPLEPVIQRALRKRGERPFDLPAVGPVMAGFGKVETYGTPGGRIAVGIDLTVKRAGDTVEPTRGKVWLTAQPVNAPGSAEVQFRNVQITGDTDTMGGDLLIALAEQHSFSEPIADALKQNFSRDLASLEGKIREALAEKRAGSLVIRTEFDAFETGVIEAHGQGLYLPVRATGEARISYRPGG